MNTCSLCGRVIPEGPPEIWHTEEGEGISVVSSAEPTALLDATDGETEVCEHCYLGEMFQSWPVMQQRDIHYQFAIAYRDHGRYPDALRACEHALALGETADILALSAYVHSEMEHADEAEALYRRALALEPGHFISGNNLKLLLLEGQMDGLESST